MNEDAYKRGFNEGYVLTAHAPELARALAKADTAAPRMEGFRDGRREYIIEQTKTRGREPERGERGPEPAKDRGMDLER